MFFFVACGGHVAVGDATGGRSGEDAANTSTASPSTARADASTAQADSSASAASPSTAQANASTAKASEGDGRVTWTDLTTATDCIGSPASLESYSTAAQLNALLVGRWRRCVAPQITGEDVGVEFAPMANTIH